MQHSGTRAASLLTLLALPALLVAQDHPAMRRHYTLVDLGTFGGPNSFVIGSTPMNNNGTVVGVADTSVFDPICGCFAYHAFKWQDGALTDLGTLPGGSFSASFAINSPGAVAGASANGLIDPDTGTEAFVASIWKRNGEVADLGTLGGSFSLALAMNDRGHAAGAATNTILDSDHFGEALTGFPSSTQWRAAIWQDGTIRDLGTLGDGPDSIAYFVNAQGQVAGDSYTNAIPNPTTGEPTVDPFFWENGHIVDIGTLGGVLGGVYGLNNRGQVVGVSALEADPNGHQHAFLWEGGSLRDLGTLGGSFDFSWANGINDSGEIIGIAATADETLQGFLWKDGAMTGLASVEGYDCSNTDGINPQGQIVGWAFPCDESSPSHAVLWERQGPGIDLNVFVPPGSDLELVEANAINNRGEIAGLALRPNGDAHAFLLVPKEGNGDAEAATVAGQDDAAPATRTASTGTHTRLTRDGLAALRARLARRHRGIGSSLPKTAN